MTKKDQIIGLLQAGMTPLEIIQIGFSRPYVYKVRCMYLGPSAGYRAAYTYNVPYEARREYHAAYYARHRDRKAAAARVRHQRIKAAREARP